MDTPQEAVAELGEYEAAGSQYAIVKVPDAADLDPERLEPPRVREVEGPVRGANGLPKSSERRTPSFPRVLAA